MENVSALAVLIGLLYLLGWIEVCLYLAPLFAPWLIESVPKTTFLMRSTPTVVMLAVGAILGSMGSSVWYNNDLFVEGL